MSSVHKAGAGGAGLFAFLHIHPAPQHVEILSHAAWRASEAILAGLKGDLCRIVHPNFGEYPFHALR